MGPVEWLQPYTEEALEELGEKGVKELVVVPISFVSEHIETLEEIDIEYREIATEAGVSNFRRVPALDTDPTFIASLADLVETSLAGPEVDLEEAAALPARTKLYPQEKWSWGWNNSSEVWNGRLAMLGFSAFLVELLQAATALACTGPALMASRALPAIGLGDLSSGLGAAVTLTTPTPSTTAVGAPQRVSGAHALMDALHRHGVSHIFGYPGGAILPIYDELHQAEARGELGTSWCAMNRAAPMPPMPTPVPPASWRLLWHLRSRSHQLGHRHRHRADGLGANVGVITGQVPRPMIGTDAFQETDIFGITLPIVEHSWLVRDPADLGSVIAKPFSLRQRAGLVRSLSTSLKMSAKNSLITCRSNPAALFPAVLSIHAARQTGHLCCP